MSWGGDAATKSKRQDAKTLGRQEINDNPFLNSLGTFNFESANHTTNQGQNRFQRGLGSDTVGRQVEAAR